MYKKVISYFDPFGKFWADYYLLFSYRKNPSNDKSKRNPEDDEKHIENDEEISSTNQIDTIDNLNINLSKLRERNMKLEHLVHTKLNVSSITQEDIMQYETINQKLFINALSKLLQENFMLKKELNNIKGIDFDTSIETGKEFFSCNEELKKHYDVTDDSSDKSNGFFQRFMKKKNGKDQVVVKSSLQNKFIHSP